MCIREDNESEEDFVVENIPENIFFLGAFFSEIDLTEDYEPASESYSKLINILSTLFPIPNLFDENVESLDDDEEDEEDEDEEDDYDEEDEEDDVDDVPDLMIPNGLLKEYETTVYKLSNDYESFEEEQLCDCFANRCAIFSKLNFRTYLSVLVFVLVFFL